MRVRTAEIMIGPAPAAGFFAFFLERLIGSGKAAGPCKPTLPRPAFCPGYATRKKARGPMVSGVMRLRNHYGAGGNGLAQDFLENHAVDLHELERGGAGQQQMNPALSAEPSAGGLIQESRQIDG